MPGLTKLFLLSKEVKKGVLALLIYFICTFSCATSSLMITECCPIYLDIEFSLRYFYSILVLIYNRDNHVITYKRVTYLSTFENR